MNRLAARATASSPIGPVLLAVGIAFLPLGFQRAVVDDLTDVPFSTAVYVFPFDVAFAVCALLAAPSLVARMRRHDLPAWMTAFAVLMAISAVSVAAHPDARGVALVARMVLALLLAVFVADSRLGTAAAAVVLATAAVQSALAVAQVVHQEPLGLGVLGEYDVPLDDLAPIVSARGTWFHVYGLAIFATLASAAGAALVARLRRADRRRLWPLVAVAAVPIGVTYSRAAVGAVVLVVAALVVGPRVTSVTRLAALAVICGAMVSAAIWNDGWVQRTTATTTAVRSGEGNALSSDRVHRIGRAIELTSRHPVLGVGPGLYLPAMIDELDLPPDEDIAPVHSFPLLALAESGVAAGLASVAFLALVGWRARRTATALALYLSLLPFFLLDQVLYTPGQGLAMVGLWAGAIEALSRPREAPASGP